MVPSHTESQLDQNKLEGAGNLPDQDLDLEAEAARVTPTRPHRESALGQDSGSGFERIGNALEVRGESISRGGLLEQIWAIGNSRRGLVYRLLLEEKPRVSRDRATCVDGTY